MWRDFMNDYFSFTSRERKGIIIIVCIILTVVSLPFFFPYFSKKEALNDQDFANEISKLKSMQTDLAQKKKSGDNFENEYVNDYSLSPGKRNEAVHALFYFDPNTASAGDWKRLGIKDKTIHTIQNYISKGGKFYKPEDISKIWGMSPSDVQRLISYVRIKPGSTSYASPERTDYPKTKSVYPAKSIQMVDINLADTNSFIVLPGIGSKLSKRIVAFRDKLGGFYAIDQVGETYLLPDSTFQKIKKQLLLGNTPVKKININTSSVDEMKSHPYVRYNIANAIFQYRQQHGDFKSLDELKKVMSITEEVYTKVLPYLSIQ